MRRDRTPEDDRRQLADDIRRAAGFMESIVAKAQRLEVGVPEAIAACVDLWRAWVRVLDRRTRE